jgi:hypothetical protein
MFAVQTTKSSDFLRIRGSVKISEPYDSRIFELNFGLKIAIWAKRNHGGESKAISPPWLERPPYQQAREPVFSTSA